LSYKNEPIISMVITKISKGGNSEEIMEYTSDSDLSDDTRELVSRGLASVKRKRRIPTTQFDSVQERFLVSNMDTSNVRHPSRRGVSFGDTSIHGLAVVSVVDAEPANSQNHNTTMTLRNSV